MYNTRDLVKNAFVAAIYVVVTLVIVPHLSFSEVQFRLSEVLLILVLFNPKYALGIILGTFLSNLASPLGIVDWVVGTGATILSIYLMLLTKKKVWLSLIMPSIVNGILVGLELMFLFEIPLTLAIGSVFLGEFVVVFIIGGLFYQLLKDHEGFIRLVG